MNKKLYLRLVYYLLGTFLVVTMFSVVTLNIFRDSRLFGKILDVGAKEEETVSGTPPPDTSRIIQWQRSNAITPIQVVTPTPVRTQEKTQSKTTVRTNENTFKGTIGYTTPESTLETPHTTGTPQHSSTGAMETPGPGQTTTGTRPTPAASGTTPGETTSNAST
ncbi:MAG TPA: hypothetical protein DD727_08515 [Clostridiales bacterium]|nr:hypothetical protein [Clostridiales bacterium]